MPRYRQARRIATLLAWMAVATVVGSLYAEPAPVVSRARIFPAPEQAGLLEGARIIASNGGETVGFVELARVAEAPSEGEWAELHFDNETAYRWVKFEGPDDSHSVVAEVEFYAGDTKLTGRPFGVAGTRGEGRTFDKALDGDTSTWFDAFLASGGYVGLDLGTDENVTPPPVLAPPPGHYDAPVDLKMTCPVAGTRIRFTTDGSVPSEANGQTYAAPAPLGEGSTPVAAVAMAPGRFRSEVVSGIYTVGDVPPPAGLATFSTGNSLSDTFNGWLEPVARSAGYDHKAYRFSVPGAPTDWLWTHPGQGFGENDYAEAFVRLAPIDVLLTQPFHGHGRSIENEAQHSGNFYMLARESSPGIQLFLYQQWPGRDFQDAWSQAKARWGPDYMAPIAEEFGLTPAETWEQAVENHTAYFETLRRVMDERYPGPPVRIIPTGAALVALKAALEAGNIPGLPRDQFFELHYAAGEKGPGWDIHMLPKGRYFVSLVIFCTLYGEPADKVSLPEETTTLTSAQDAVYKRIAWEAVRDYVAGHEG
jgi:hypothetical protein